MTWWLMTSELKRMLNEDAWPNHTYCHICLGGLKRTKKTLSHYSKYMGHVLNVGPPNYKTGFLSTQLWHLIMPRKHLVWLVVWLTKCKIFLIFVHFICSILEEKGNLLAPLDSTVEDIKEEFSDDDFDVTSAHKGNVSVISWKRL
jgi:hypothetical protein